jgi:hypothetical protein
VLRVPESIGFVPYIGSARMGDGSHLIKSVELDGGGSLRVDQGTNDAWLRELLSPAFTQWLQRNPDDFEWELADGVLCASRSGHLRDQPALAALCADAARLATTVREECLEEVETGEAKRSAAKTEKPAKARDRLVDTLISRTTFANPPADVESTRPQFREQLLRHPSTYLIAFWTTLAFMVGINIIGGGIYGLLLNLGNPGRAVIVYQVILLAVVGPLVLRSQVNGLSEELASRGFWREYMRTHGLTEEDPSLFAATHAKADLPGAPKRVMTGLFGGVDGALMLTGDGNKRGDVIALVAGETGPTASAAFDVSAPGPSTAALDDYVARLAGELRERSRAGAG